MATIEQDKVGRHAGKIKMVKKSTRVDLTPMVDLGFLLVTFFVFTTTMAKPTAMKVEMPFDKVPPDDNICNSCVLTAVLCKNDKILYYEGDITNAAPLWSDFGSFRQIIIDKRKKVEMARSNKDEFVLIIKPTEDCLFKNFVDITDEVTINRIKRYYIDDLRPKEKEFLKL